MNPNTDELRRILDLLREGQWNAAHDRVQQVEGLLDALSHARDAVMA